MASSGKGSGIALVLGAFITGFLFWVFVFGLENGDPEDAPEKPTRTEMVEGSSSEKGGEGNSVGETSSEAWRSEGGDETEGEFEATGSEFSSSPGGSGGRDSDSGTVFGRVVDGTGVGISGATVRAAPDQMFFFGEAGHRNRARTTTDENGSYRLELPVSRSAYALTVGHDDFASTTRRGVAVRKEGEVEVAEVTLTPGGEVTGRVMSEWGTAVPGARLFVETRPEESSPFATLFRDGGYGSVLTEEDGSFRLPHLSPGTHRIRVEAEGFALSMSSELKVTEGSYESDVTIRIGKGKSLSGSVFDDLGNVVEGARVKATRGGPGVLRTLRTHGGEEDGAEGRGRTKTAVDGTFRLENLTDDPYLLEIGKPGYATLMRADLAAGAESLEFTLQRTGGIRGRVVDRESGEPVERFSVGPHVEKTGFQVFRAGSSANSLRKRSFDDDEGVFTLEGVAPGKYDLEVRALGFATEVVEGVMVESGGMGEEIEVRLGLGATVRGRVVRASDGEPVEGARVELLPEGESGGDLLIVSGVSSDAFSRRDQDEVKTEGDGSFSISDLAAGVYALRVTHDLYSTQKIEGIDLGPEEIRGDVEVRLTGGGAIEGTVYGAGGEPMPQATVSIQSSRGFFTRKTTDGEGYYRQGGLDPGTYYVKRDESSQGFVMVRSLSLSSDEGVGEDDARFVADGIQVEVEEGEVARVDLFEQEKSTLRGIVTEHGEVVPDITVELVKNSGGIALPTRGVSDQDGNFEFEGLEPGSYSISIPSEDRERTLFVEAVEVRAGRVEEVNIFLPTGVIEGRVVSLASNEPVAGADLVLRQRTEGGGNQARIVIRAGGPPKRDRSDERGFFRIGRVQDGEYDLTVTKVGFETEKVASITVEDGAVVDEVTARLRPGGGVTGTVTEESGAAVAYAMIEVLDAAGTSLPEPRFESSGADGRFTILGLAPGSYVLRVFRPGTREGTKVPVKVSVGEPQEVPIALGAS